MPGNDEHLANADAFYGNAGPDLLAVSQRPDFEIVPARPGLNTAAEHPARRVALKRRPVNGRATFARAGVQAGLELVSGLANAAPQGQGGGGSVAALDHETFYRKRNLKLGLKLC